MLKTKSVWTQVSKTDGLRVLVTRFRGHGLPVSRYDVWMPSLGPSEQLLRDKQSGRIRWLEFKNRYRHELFMDGPIDSRSRTIKNHGQKFTLRLLKALARKQIVILCHCAEDEDECHRHLLAKIIAGL
jgi:uncharacterized protein YeaO (DUF488 family)